MTRREPAAGGDPIRVAIACDPAPGTGIARYARRLIALLGERGDEVAAELFSFGLRPPRPPWLPESVAFRHSPLPGRIQRLLNRRLGIPAERLYGLQAPALLHTIDPQPIRAWAPRVTTVFDVAWRHLGPQYESVVSKRWIEDAEQAIREARHILAISRTTARDLVAGGVPEERITVTHLGVDAAFGLVSGDDIRRVRQTYDLPSAYILYVGALNVRKNIGVLVEALRHFPGSPPLVLAGPPPAEGLGYWGLDRIPARQLGYVPDQDLPPLYAAASACVVPSSWEGYGLPLVEAMAAGTPVLAARIPVFEEIGGEVPLYFEPDDPAVLRSALEGLLRNPTRQVELQAQGRQRAAAFSWEACCQATVSAYRRLVAGG